MTRKNESMYHTVVVHINPDLESTALLWLLFSYPQFARRLRYSSVSERVGVVAEPEIKFIPAGPLRKEDWASEPEVTVEALIQKGYMFLDCAGGEFDHHPHQASSGSNIKSSLDTVVEQSGADVKLAFMRRIFRKISKNDTVGEDIVKDTSYHGSDTPHTPRHLRNILMGWNLQHHGNGLAVIKKSRFAYCAIAALAEAIAQGNLPYPTVVP